MPRLLFLVAAVMMIAVPNPALAQVDSGTLLRQAEPPRDNDFQRSQEVLRQVDPLAVSPAEALDSERVTVRDFKLFGNSSLPNTTIEEILAPYRGQELNLAQLNQIAHILTMAYRNAGYFATNVYLPPHLIKDGVVMFHVVEGYLQPGGLEIVNESRVKSGLIQRFLNEGLKDGQLLTERKLERALLLVSDLPGMFVNAELLPGETEGAGILRVQAEQPKFLHGQVSFDNFGSYATGTYRGSIGLGLNSPLGIGDALDIQYSNTGGDSHFVHASYGLPIGVSGLHAEASIGYLDYELVDRFDATRPTGTALSLRGILSYPIIRSRKTNIRVELDYIYGDLEDRSLGMIFSKRKLNDATVRFSGSHIDNVQGGGVTTFFGSATFGDVDLDGFLPNKISDGLTANTQGGFSKFNFGASRNQRLGGGWTAFMAVSAQLASDNLDTFQKFGLGGPFSVAGYPITEVNGDEGSFLQFDLRHNFRDVPWGGQLQLSGGYTHGRIRLNNSPFLGFQGFNPDLSNSFVLQSLNLGAHQTWPGGPTITGLLGIQLGDNENANPATGSDSDFSTSDVRGWISIAYPF